MSAVRPAMLVALGFAPAASSRRMLSIWQWNAAVTSGVQSSPAAVASAATCAARSALMMSSLPTAAASLSTLPGLAGTPVR